MKAVSECSIRLVQTNLFQCIFEVKVSNKFKKHITNFQLKQTNAKFLVN